jgi:hypothetical protein
MKSIEGETRLAKRFCFPSVRVHALTNFCPHVGQPSLLHALK